MMQQEYIMLINLATGEINEIKSIPPVDPPEEGSTTDTGYFVKYIPYPAQDNMPNWESPAQFVERYLWIDEEWFDRGDRPNEYHYWNTSDNTWTCLTDIVIENVRKERNIKLAHSDATQISDYPLSEEKKAEWRVYRQTLRDIMENLPEGLTHENEMVWPSEPS